MDHKRRRNINVGKYWLTAFAFICLRLFGLTTLVFLIIMALEKDISYLSFAGGAFALTALAAFILLVNTRDVICPLCRTPAFQGLGGAQRAKRKLRLPFAFKLLARQKSPRCIHCREAFRWL